MSRRFATIIIFSLMLIGIGLVISFVSVGQVNAQCKTVSECKNCHEGQGQKAVSTTGAWHIDHAPYDFCATCHGGNPNETRLENAHNGVSKDLTVMAANCKSCHEDQFEVFYQKYAVSLNLPGKPDLSLARKPAVLAVDPSNPLSGAGFNPLNKVKTTPQPNPTLPSYPADNSRNYFSGAILIVLLAGSLWLVFSREPTWRQTIWGFIKQENWSPYLAGVLLGLVGILSVWLGRHLLSASGGFATLASTLVNRAAADPTQNNMYFKFIMPPGLNWEVFIIAGIAAGGALGAITSRTFKVRWSEDSTWNKIFGPQKWKRFVLAFLGAVIVQYGAGIAGGCTSGLAISGGMTLAPSAFLFMGGMFASGIVTALILFRKRY